MDAATLLLTLVFFLPIAVLVLAQAVEGGPHST